MRYILDKFKRSYKPGYKCCNDCSPY